LERLNHNCHMHNLGFFGNLTADGRGKAPSVQHPSSREIPSSKAEILVGDEI
jgi:hypothetical protein